METPTCPFCQSTHRQVKNGHTASGTPQYRCQTCQKTYRTERKPHGHSKETRQKALQMYLEGIGFRRIARLLGVNHQSVANWVNAAHHKLPETPASPQPSIDTIERDELFTFVGSKKTKYSSSL